MLSKVLLVTVISYLLYLYWEKNLSGESLYLLKKNGERLELFVFNSIRMGNLKLLLLMISSLVTEMVIGASSKEETPEMSYGLWS